MLSNDNKYIHTFIHSYIHTFIHTYIHTYIHTWLGFHQSIRKLIKVPITPCNNNIMILETRLTTWMEYQFIHSKIRLLSPSIGGVHQYQIYDIFQLSNLSLTSPNRNNAYITKKKKCLLPKSKVFRKNLLYQRILLEGFTVLIWLSAAEICEV